MAVPIPTRPLAAVLGAIALLAGCQSSQRAPARSGTPESAGTRAPAPAPSAPARTRPMEPVVAAARSGASSGIAPAAAVAPWPTGSEAFVARLHADASSGRDPELAAYVDLLAIAERFAAEGTSETSVRRLPDAEKSERERFGRGTPWVTLATYVEPGADARALRAAYLDFDRVAEYTGRPGTRTLERRGDVVVAYSDAVQRILGFEFGARWRFEAKAIDRGPARVIAGRQADDPTAWRMLGTHGLVLALPEAGGVRVIEIQAAVVDFEIPSLFQGPVSQAALKDVTARTNGIREHWREYVDADEGGAGRRASR